MDGLEFYRQSATAIVHYLAQELNITPSVHYRIGAATSGPRVLTLSIVVNPRYAPKITSLAEQLSMAARLDKSASIRIARGNRGTLTVEIPKPKSLWYHVSMAALPRRRGLLMTVGLDNEHRPALVNFSDPLTPHALIAGTTGSGKTNVQRLLVYDLATQNGPEDVRLLLIDTRKRGMCWKPFERLPHLVHPVITDEAAAIRALAWTVAEVDRRAADGRSRPHIFIGIDETQDLLETEQFVKPVSDLAAVGREFGVHLLLATQNPTAKQLGGSADLKRNLSCRLVGKTDSATSAAVAAGIPNSGAERLTGAGDFLLVQPDGMTRLTAALLTDKDTARLPRGEASSTLDLAQYDDIDHVLASAASAASANIGCGRPAEPVEPEHLALALADSQISQRELNRQFAIGFQRARRVLDLAASVRVELERLGYIICNATNCNEIPRGCPWAAETERS